MYRKNKKFWIFNLKLKISSIDGQPNNPYQPACMKCDPDPLN